MIDQFRHLQAQTPFETFSIELANGRVLEIHDRHSVATTDGTRPEEAMIGVLLTNGFSGDQRQPGRQCQRRAASQGQGTVGPPEGAA